MKIKDATQTKDGTPVRIYATDGGFTQTILHGAVQTSKGWQIAIWDNSGYFAGPAILFTALNNDLDLDLHDWWEDIPWEYLEDWIQCVVMDPQNQWFGGTINAFEIEKDGICGITGESIIMISGIKMPMPPDWQNSKVKRPEGM